MKVFCVLFIVNLLRGPAQAGLCPGESQAFTENTCISVESGTSSFTTSSSACSGINSGNLVTVTTENELSAVLGYVAAIGDDSSSYWIGYSYDDSNLVDINNDDAPSLVTNEVLENNLPSEEGVCVAANNSESGLVRVSCSSSLGYVCLYNLTDPNVLEFRLNNVTVSEQHTVSVGMNISLSCLLSGVSPSAIVTWTFNGDPVTMGVSTSSMTTELELTPFLKCGEYRCTVTNEDGRSASEAIEIFGDIDNILAPPTPVEFVAVVPNSRSSLFIQWMQPERTYVISPLLISYTLYYSTERPLNYSASSFVSNLRTGADGMGRYVLDGLQTGTVYYVGMRAENGAGTSDDPSITQLVKTYGNAPTTAPSNLQLSRNTDNTALLADWDDVITTPPTGRVAFYRVEFRDLRSDRTNSEDATVLFINPRFSAATIFNIRDAQSYEVRVATAVQILRRPAEYELSPFTNWEAVSFVVTTISPIPTIQGSEDSATDAILAGTIVPVVVLCIVIVVIVLIIAAYLITTKTRKIHEQTDGGLCANCKRNKNFDGSNEMKTLNDN